MRNVAQANTIGWKLAVDSLFACSSKLVRCERANSEFYTHTKAIEYEAWQSDVAWGVRKQQAACGAATLTLKCASAKRHCTLRDLVGRSSRVRPSRAGAETAAASGAWHGEALIGARLILIVISYACCPSARAAFRLDLLVDLKGTVEKQTYSIQKEIFIVIKELLSYEL